MTYTVRQLAVLSGISIRALRWYDEIGLLKPAYYGGNGYRYYEEEQLLLLQQVLFFRELGFKLSEIEKIVSTSEFNKIKSLNKHRKFLEENLDHTQGLIEIIDKTVSYLKGELEMKDKEMFGGFDPDKRADYECQEMTSSGTIAEELIGKSPMATGEWGEKEFKKMAEENNTIFKAVAELIEKGLGPRDTPVQKLIEAHFKNFDKVYSSLTKELYLAYAQLYCEHPEFRKWFERHDDRLASFFAEAMRVFVQARP